MKSPLSRMMAARFSLDFLLAMADLLDAARVELFVASSSSGPMTPRIHAGLGVAVSLCLVYESKFTHPIQ